jgi:hypothetical protein
MRDGPRRPGRYPNLHKGETQKHDNTPTKTKKVYTTEREDGLLVAHESHPVGFGPEVEVWSLDWEV